MDNIFELIPFILIILWSILGAGGAKKKQEEQRRRAEEQRRAREAQRGGVGSGGDSEDRFGAGEASRARDAAAEARAETRAPGDTAADMVPDELWRILTGGAPPPTRTPGPVRTPPEVEYEPEAEYSPDVEYEPEYQPTEPGGWTTSPPWDEEDAVHSIEGVSAETAAGDLTDYDDAADATARARYDKLRRFSWDDAEARPVEVDERSDRRHVAFHTRLAEREIGAPEAARGPDLRQRLGLGDLDAVRRAIVLAEVLGPPKSLQ